MGIVQGPLGQYVMLARTGPGALGPRAPGSGPGPGAHARGSELRARGPGPGPRAPAQGPGLGPLGLGLTALDPRPLWPGPYMHNLDRKV